MGKKIVLFLFVVAFRCYLVFPQESCDHKRIIKEFLETISSSNYKSSFDDYQRYFDLTTEEIEERLRSEYLKNNPEKTDNKSFVIEKVLDNEALKYLIKTKACKNHKWVITSSYKVGLTIIYVIGIENSIESFQIKMINLPEENRCGIGDILDSTGKSLFWN